MLKFNKILTLTVVLSMLVITLAGCGQKAASSSETRWKIQIAGSGVDKVVTDKDMEKLGIINAKITMTKKDGSTEEHEWTGVPLSKVLEFAGIKEFNKVTFESQDGYKVDVPKDVALAEKTLVTFKMDGKDLAEGDGPVRMVVDGQPSKYWVRALVKINVE